MKSVNKKPRKLANTHKKKRHPENKDGWIHLEVGGTPYEIGFAHGASLRRYFPQVLRVLPFNVAQELKIPYADYLRDCKRLFGPILDDDEWSFIKEELRGIVAGAAMKGVTYDFLVAWNSYLSMLTYYEKNHNSDHAKNHGSSEGTVDKNLSRCCAFIATGNATKTGEIVMAHNTHSDFATGFVLNVIMKVKPALPGSNTFVMQTAPGLICSSTDWFLCDNGIMGCETTISNLNYTPDFSKGPTQPTVANSKVANSTVAKVPYYLRIRKAMQFGKTLDDYVDIMSKNSAGDYACTWYLGDVNTGEIMMLEDGGEKIGVRRTRDGAFHGCNDAMTEEVAMIQTTSNEKHNPNSSTGARNLRMEYLLFDKYAGKLDTTNAKKILSDHYDVSRSKYRMGKMNICKHTEMERQNKDSEKDAKKDESKEKGGILRDSTAGATLLGAKGALEPWVPLRGATDGKVVDSAMARKLQFEGRMGSSCGRVFRRSDFGLPADVPILDMPRHKWTKIV